jgi:hypothetical protein
MATPRDEGSVLLGRGTKITEVAVAEKPDNFRVGRRPLEAALF